jgi:hypothetical protein
MFAGRPSWDDDAYEDLVQDVVVKRLLEEHQLEYLFLTATSLEDFERLLTVQVRRVLARRRERTVLSNLIERTRPILATAPFRRVDDFGPSRFHLDGAVIEHREPTAAELAEGVLAARAIPRLGDRGSADRAPRVYSTSALKALVGSVAQSLPTSFALRDLESVLQKCLTDLLPPDLDHIEEVDMQEPDLPVQMEIREAVDQLVRLFTPEQAEILRLKAADVADAEVAARLDMSRPTAADRKQALFALIREATEQYSEDERDLILDLAIARVASGLEWA